MNPIKWLKSSLFGVPSVVDATTTVRVAMARKIDTDLVHIFETEFLKQPPAEVLSAIEIRKYIWQKEIYGLISKRAWGQRYEQTLTRSSRDIYLQLTSVNQGYEWQVENRCDKPTISNWFGYYSYEYKADCSGVFGNCTNGIIENRGRILVHLDRVVRSEWARILFVFTESQCLEGLRKRYPDVMITTANNYPLIEKCLAEAGLV